MDRRPFALALLLGAGLAAWMLGAGSLGAADATVMGVFPPAFSPSSVTINVNDQVTWTGITGNHTVSRDDGLLESANDFSHRFTQAGTFDYFCRIHVGMTGRVVVQSVAPTNTPTNTPTPRPIPTHVPGQPRQLVPLAADNAGLG